MAQHLHIQTARYCLCIPCTVVKAAAAINDIHYTICQYVAHRCPCPLSLSKARSDDPQPSRPSLMALESLRNAPGYSLTYSPHGRHFQDYRGRTMVVTFQDQTHNYKSPESVFSPRDVKLEISGFLATKKLNGGKRLHNFIDITVHGGFSSFGINTAR